MIRTMFKALVYLFAIIGFVLVAVYAAVEFGLTKTSGIVDEQHDYFQDMPADTYVWIESDEWATLKEAILKDAQVIQRAATDAGVPSRLIASVLIVEQLRLFNSEREIFKTIFSPLKILGNQTQFSWGVMGIKQDTARQIENHLKDSQSPWYLGTEYEHILDFTGSDPDTQRFQRLTNEDDRYYSYLYAGLFMHEITAEWDKAGFPINKRPEIIATLYDLGFEKSVPKENPRSGGAAIEIASSTYSFGGLAKSFYDSEELVEVFPK